VLEMMIAWMAVQQEEERGRFFVRREIDFFGRKQPPRRADTWAEPIVGADGKIRLHVPSAEVIDLLESPTPRNAERYLERQRERMEKMRRAMEAVAAIQGKRSAASLYYFSRPGCPYCLEQERVLGSVRLEGVSVHRVPPDSPLWAQYGIRRVPSLVLVKEAGQVRTFEGFTPKSLLEQEVRRGDR